jgi:ATP-dependent DNA ligase
MARSASRAAATTWAERFPAIVDAALRINATSFRIDGEAVIAREDGTPDFHALRSQRRGNEAVLYVFDLLEHDGNGLRRLPLLERKRRLARLLGWVKRPSIQFVERFRSPAAPASRARSPDRGPPCIRPACLSHETGKAR